MAEGEAAKHGKTMDRNQWRLVVNMHCAEDDERAMRDVRIGEQAETLTYFSETLGRPPMRAEDPLRDGLVAGSTLVGFAGNHRGQASSACWPSPMAGRAASCSAPMNGRTGGHLASPTSCSPAG